MNVKKCLTWMAAPLALGGATTLLLGANQPRIASAQATNVTAEIRTAPIEDALSIIAESARKPLVINPETARQARPVSISVSNKPVEAAARAVARAAGVPVTITKDAITVGPEEEDSQDLTPPRLETQVYGQTQFLPNAPAAVRVVALRHDTGAPVPGADVWVTLSKAAEAGPAGKPGFARMLFRGRTDASGSVNASFNVPNLPVGSYGFSITTAALGERDHVAQTVSLKAAAQVLLTTDKPVYQPGQLIHIRALALEEPNRTPSAAKDATIEVADSKGNKVFKHREKTTIYGIVAAEFQLADEINMGAYKITATVGPAVQEKTVNVERYVLPKFKVTFTPDRTWYAPGESLSGVVSAQYFFGKPVAGKVTISLASFDAGFNEFAKVTGTLDESGHFRFTEKLPTFFAGQPLEQGNAFVKADVVVTDTADHDEKATKSVPVAASGLKVTIVPESPQTVVNTPNRVYVVTSQPDGAAVAADYRLTVNAANTGTDRVISGRTDATGVAVAEFVPRSENSQVQVTARDRNGQSGMSTLSLSGVEDSVLLRADRALYRVGDRMNLSALSAGGRATLYFDIIRDRQTVLTKSSDLKDGRANVAIDLTQDLTGTLEIHAYRIGRDGNIRRDTRVVYVDPANDLKVAATPDKQTYLPGEGAKVRFTVTGPDGSPRPAALGIAIVDESVFALQDMQPGMEKVYFLLEKEILEPRYEIHSITPDEIVRPLGTPAIELGRQRAAGALFAALPRRDEHVMLLANTYQAKQEEIVQRAWGLVIKEAEAVRLALVDYRKVHGDVPSLSGNMLTTLMLDGRLKSAATKDPWGRPYTVTAISASYRDGFTLRSEGPDGKVNTGDEITVYASLDQPVAERYAWQLQGFRQQRARGFAMGGAGGVAWDMNGDVALGMPMRRGDALGAMAPMVAPMAKGEALLMNGAVMEASAAGRQGVDNKAAAPARVREYFPETLLFQPSLITDNRGIAVLDVPMADSITTWRLTATASSRAGALGSVTAPMKAFQDFFVDINFLVQLTQGDEVSVPVSVYNYLPTAQNVTLTADREGWFELLDDPQKTVTLQPNEVKGVRYKIRATGLGFQKLTIRAQGTSRADAVRREVEIIPNGKRVEQAFNGRLTGTVHQTVKIPETSVTGASNIIVKVYPGLFSTVVEGMDKVFRMPFGCFEQTSSVTYPNILVLDYIKLTKRVSPEIQMKAEQYINLGYQRLLSYEVEGGGFSWFGSAPANKVLTAYGLQEFADMSAVWEVDTAMIARTRGWVASQQEPDGSWSPDKDYIDEGLGPMWKSNLLSTAYIGWGMAESLRPLPNQGADQPTQKALNYLRNHAKEANNSYALAILANAFVSMAPDDPITKDTLDRLLAQKTDEGDKTWWMNDQATVTFAGGDSATIETTALAAYALIRAGQAPDVATRALNYLISKKDPSGTWGTTQATILTLKTMIAGLGAQVQKGEASIRVMVNGNEAGTIKVTPDNADVMQQVDAKTLVQPGDNQIELIVTGQGQMMYGISAYHYTPWGDAEERKGPLEIDVKYDRTRLAQDETLKASVSITFNPRVLGPMPGRPGLPAPKAANMVVVDLGIPPGFTVDGEDLKGLVDRKIVDRYELTGRQVILYFEKIEAGPPVTFDLRMRAQYPLRARTPKSVVYQYYDPSIRATVEPVSLEVTE